MPSRKRVHSSDPQKFKSTADPENQLSRKCINKGCKGGKNLTDAIDLACSYYQVTCKKGKQVCEKCLIKCMNHYKRLANKFINGECIYDSTYPNYDKYYEIASSTSEEEEQVEEQQQPMPNISGDLSNNEDRTIADILHQVVEKFFIHNKSLIKDQIELSKTYLSEEGKTCMAEFDYIKEMSSDLQSKIDALRNRIHDLNIKESDTSINVVETVDLGTLDKYYVESAKNKTKDIKLENLNIDDDVIINRTIKYISPDNLPSIGSLDYPRLKTGDLIYTNMKKVNGFEPWSQSKIRSVISRDRICVQFTYHYSKVITTKHIAYYTSSPVRFSVGTRVISKFSTICSYSISGCNNGFYPGVIGEDPTAINTFRYLIFFENGNVQYQQHENIRLIVHKSKCVSNDVHPDLQKFIKSYLIKYPDRQMAKLTKDNLVQAKYKNSWEEAKVVQVDASIVQLYFKESKESKWFYRGSSSLYNIYKKQLQSEKGICLIQSELAFLNEPFVESTNVEPINSASKMYTAQRRNRSKKKRNKKKKNKKNRCQTKQNMQNQHLSYAIKPIQLPDNVPKPKEYMIHNCDQSCVDWITYNHQNIQSICTLATPLYFGFERSSELNRIIYITPCGKLIRDINEMFKFLIMTQSTFTIDQFSFDDCVKPLTELKILECKKFMHDLSCGRELKSISVVNNISKRFPPKIEYITSRKAMHGVEINVDSNFLCGCDCTDNCQDKSKCACWKLTIEGQRAIGKQNVLTNIGYNYRRLSECVTTGIYECNKNCKCSNLCLNRVVQYPLSHKLQLFMTEKKGWGVRCLNDIPQGSFVCIYAGYLLTESDANEGGINYGDEYLAEVDYIELVERVKKDFESDVPISDEEENYLNDDTSDEDYQSKSEGIGKISNASNMLLRKRKPTIITKTKHNERDVPTQLNSSNRKNNLKPSKSVREYFGANESVYVMDAKTMGNIGRYLNHSCTPNLFVQNVFVDTYDLRFPWISFFAQCYIPSGTELTWDYNYALGSVPGKEIHCHCGSLYCRGRLL